MATRYESRNALSSDGTRIAIRDYGSASDGGSAADSAVVLIHGYCCSQLVFARQVASSLATRLRLVTYDLRGHGQSGKPAEPASYSTNKLWSDDLHAVLEELGIEHAVLVGWSMGGRVAANYLYTHGAARVRGVNFVDTPALADPARPCRGPDCHISQETLSTDWERFIVGTARFMRACSAAPMTGEDFDLMFGAAMAVPLVARQGSYQWHIDYGDALRKVTVPILATHGLADRLCLPVAAEAIADRLPNVELSFFPGAGHMPFWESADRFNTELERFAARCLSTEQTAGTSPRLNPSI